MIFEAIATRLDAREKGACPAGHLPRARHPPRDELEPRVNREPPDPTAGILDAGVKAWRDMGPPLVGEHDA